MSGKPKYQDALKERIKLIKDDAKFWQDFGDRDLGELSEDQRNEVKDRNKRIEELENYIVEAQPIADAQKQSASRQREVDTFERNEAKGGRLPVAGDDGRAASGREIKTLGERVVDNTTFNQWREQMTAGGAVSRAKFGTSPGVAVKTLITGAGGTSAGALVDNQFLGLLDQNQYQRPIAILDLITIGQTDSDTVDYVIQGAVTNNAAPVAEATATSGSSGTKPESAMAFSAATATVKNIAHWIPATRRALMDAAGLRTLINEFLLYGLREELADQVLTGDGVGENFTGLLNVSGTQSQAFDTNPVTTTRKARTKVRIGGRTNPTAYVMHPNDWEDFDLLQDNEARYYYGGPSVLGTPRLWGLPVVEEEGMTEGTAMVANWRFAVLWRRMAAQIFVSDSHADFFIRNLIAILAEEPSAFGVIRPAAFVEIDLTP